MVKRGDICWVDLPEPHASEPGYRRPVLVVQSNDFNRSTIETVIVAMLTTNMRLSQAPGNVTLLSEDSGLLKNSVVNVSQIYTIPLSSLQETAGSVNESIMRTIDNGLKEVMSLF